MIAHCSTCGEAFEGGTLSETMVPLRAHRKEAHPGQKASGATGKGETAEQRRERQAAARARKASGEGGDSTGATPDPSTPVETPPQDLGAVEVEPAKPRLRDRLWGKRPDPTGTQPQSRERKPSTRRVDTSDLLGMLWAGAGWLLVRTEADIPVGRCLIFQRDVAGDILQRVTRDTFIDKAIQPLAGRLDELEALGSLIGIPMMVGLIERSPELQGPLEPMLRLALQAHLTAMVPLIKKQQAAEAKFAKVAADLGLEGDDPIGAMLDALFAREPEPQAAPANAA